MSLSDEVFALGGRTRDDEAADLGYYGLRITLGLAIILAIGFLLARPAEPDRALLELLDGTWLAFNPTEFVAGHTDDDTQIPSIDSVVEDIRRIRRHTGIKGIISFGADGTELWTVPLKGDTYGHELHRYDVDGDLHDRGRW
mgnify:CR=1 FL=1